MFLFLKKNIFIIVYVSLVLAITKSFWLYSPLTIKMEFIGNGSLFVKMMIENSECKIFNKEKSVSLPLHNKLDFQFLKIDGIKNLKFLIFFTQDSPIILKKIYINNLYSLDMDIDSFSIIGASVDIVDNSMLITPTEPIVEIQYNDFIDNDRKIKFNLKNFLLIIFIIILSYKIINRLNMKKILNSDSIFILICTLIVIIPILSINRNIVSFEERKVLDGLEPLINQGGLNLNFGRNFDNWFQDRIGCRKLLVTIEQYINYYLNTYYSNNTLIMDKKSGFFYTKEYDAEKTYQNANLFDKDQLETIVKNIKYLNDLCIKNNTKLYVFMSVDKETIYPEYYPKAYIKKNVSSRYNQVYNKLSKIENLNLISPKDVLLKEKEKNQVFLKTDTHLSPFSAFSIGSLIEYNLLMSSIKKDFPDVKILEKNDFYSDVRENYKGDIVSGIHIPDIQSEDVKINKLKEPTYKITNRFLENYSSLYIYSNPESNNNYNVVIVGDSFHQKYRELLAQTFKDFTSIFFMSGSPFILTEEQKQKAFEKKPDILIIETTERLLERFLDLKSFDDIFEYDGV